MHFQLPVAAMYVPTDALNADERNVVVSVSGFDFYDPQVMSMIGL